jgi:hypothetical protein
MHALDGNVVSSFNLVHSTVTRSASWIQYRGSSNEKRYGRLMCVFEFEIERTHMLWPIMVISLVRGMRCVPNNELTAVLELNGPLQMIPAAAVVSLVGLLYNRLDEKKYIIKQGGSMHMGENIRDMW